ncbi:hypothetical protein PPYR_13946 [Photinus pyralis]|uniref:Uncharacterized protein n=1 Tax=Photinus pyralis TaxID=7054 RepID=A0A1Y1NKL3_PHOPY|nr:uncharacterized protein LOC116180839 [Photinus pyralis]KAB0791985.1 hypothetical protein PPYR_13946 [Photinus pyralis]
MDQGAAEKKLTIFYSLSVGLGAIASITSGIAWGHWKQTLDQCVGRNCSCILYGTHTPTVFLGGRNGACIWVTYGPLIYILISIAMACFHGFRVLFSRKKTITRTVTAKNEVGETIELHAVQGESTNPLPRAFWITMACITSFFTIYALTHFSIFADGFLTTCKQYRLALHRQLRFSGTVTPVIHERLACTAIFDFMDYIQPDSGNAYREGYINTGLDLSLGISAAFFSWILFLGTSVINIRYAAIKV